MTVNRFPSPLALVLCYYMIMNSLCSAIPSNHHIDKEGGTEYLKPFVHEPKPNMRVRLQKDFRIQYLVITGQAYKHRAHTIWATWGPSVSKIGNDSLLFISDSGISGSIDSSRGHITDMPPTLNVIDNLDSLSPLQRYRRSQLKWMRALILSDSFEPFDWLIFLDDDTFLIHHAMREILQRYDPAISLMLARKNGNFSVRGGAGMVMSKGMVLELTSSQHRFNLIQAFETAVKNMKDSTGYYADIILSKFIYGHNIGKIVNLRELKSEGTHVISEWYKKHPETNKSAVITYHHVSNRAEYLALYHHYYTKQ